MSSIHLRSSDTARSSTCSVASGGIWPAPRRDILRIIWLTLGMPTIFVCEPQVSAHLQIARFLRLGADFGYRVVAGIDKHRVSDFRGFLGGVHLQVGWF